MFLYRDLRNAKYEAMPVGAALRGRPGFNLLVDRGEAQSGAATECRPYNLRSAVLNSERAIQVNIAIMRLPYPDRTWFAP